MQPGECRATLSDHFFFSDYEAMHKLALMLRHLPLSLRDAYTFAISPADPDDPIIASALLSFATAYCQRWGALLCMSSYAQPVQSLYGPGPCPAEYLFCSAELPTHLSTLLLCGRLCYGQIGRDEHIGPLAVDWQYMGLGNLLCCPLQ